ncbi:MAG: hypothetical protein RLZZ618_3615 [Pseudomonadota bacterium]|jgi:hypothetical protein
MSLRAVDFLHPPSAPRLGWWLLAAGLISIALAVGAERHSAREQAEASRVTQQAVEVRRAQERAARQAVPVSPTDKRQRQAQAELARPWLPALRGIEAATSDPVYLVSLKFDRGIGQLRLEAEAPTFDEALAYLQRLGRNAPLSAVALTFHEETKDPATGRSLVKFSAVATWSGR